MPKQKDLVYISWDSGGYPLSLLEVRLGVMLRAYDRITNGMVFTISVQKIDEEISEQTHIEWCMNR